MEPPGCSSTEGAMLSGIALNDNKAGMEGLDKEKINKIILEVSKGSRFYENEVKKEHQVNQRIEKMLRHKSEITEQQIQKAQAEVDKMTSELERRRELGRVIVHVDMDAFYAAVEMKDCPELKEKPMAVGSMSMLSTSNYHARRYGVRAAMPGFIAKKLCPNLVIVPLNFNKYRAVSEQVREIFADYDPQFLPMSLDEAYLDITEHLEQRQHWPESRRTYRLCEDKREGEMDIVMNVDREDTLSPVLFDDSPSASPSVPGTDGKVELFGTSPEEAVREMRFRIEQKTTLTASAGIAPNTMLAKVCSDKNKPNGQYRIPPDTQTVMDFIQDLPVRKVSGIGKVTEKMLAALGIVTCSQLREQMAMLSLLFSETSWHHFLRISLGLGSTHLERDSERKSMSTERTFAEMSDVEEQYSLCRELCHDLAEDLRKEGIKGKTITLKLKNVSFEVKTRAFTLQYAVCTEEEIFAAAKELLRVEIDHVSPHPLRLRLMGVRVSSFISTDDKHHQQKSIVGFLKTVSDLKSSTQLSASKPEPDCGISSKKQPCPEMRSSLRSEETPRPVHKKVTGSGGTAASPQQTFFQKAYAKRLQKQSEQEQTLSIINGHQTDTTSKCLPGDSEITGFNATNNETPVKTETCSSERSSDTDETVDKAGTHSNIRTSPRVKSRSIKKASSNTLQCFTCPVCFTEIETTDLTVFNCHIDECLCSGVDDVGTSVDVGQDVYKDEERSAWQSEVEKDRPMSNHCSADSSSVESVNEVLHTSSVSLTQKNLSENKAHFDSRIPFFKRIASMKEKPDNIRSDPAAFQQAGSSDGDITQPMDAKVSTLTCPVCNRAQDTDDLTLFNHHVDMCLNQEVLLELRETNPQRALSDAASPEKVKGHEKVSNARGKTKRRGSSPPPPSKKTKTVGTKHTIDKFFVGNKIQKF